MKRQDIMNSSDEEKDKVYRRIDTLHQLGLEVTIKKHKSGFPAVTVDCGDEHILTDILSLEEWRRKNPKTE